MDRIEIKIFLPRATLIKWRLRRNGYYILAYALDLFAGLAVAVFLGFASKDKAGLSDSGWGILLGFLLALIAIIAAVAGVLAYFCWTYGVLLYESQTIVIGKAKMSVSAESSDGKGNSIGKTMPLAFLKEGKEYFRIGSKSSRFVYVPKAQLTPEQSSFIRSLVVSKPN